MGDHQTQPATDSLSPESAFSLLRHSRRRAVLAVLEAADQRLTLHDLTNEIAVREQDARITDVQSEPVTNLYLSLVHCHVPKLADANVVTYDEERELVGTTDRLEQLRPYLSMAIEADPSSHSASQWGFE